MTTEPELAPIPLPDGIRSRFVNDVNGLRVHILEAGASEPGRPVVLMLHGFPELAYSWRHVMLPLTAAGYHVVAPDQRGYGRTTGWDASYDGDLYSFRKLNLVRDALALVSALGYREVACVMGHDFGSPVASWSTMVRPDVFKSVVMMSASFSGPASFPFDTDRTGATRQAEPDIFDTLAKLPRPRKHYQRYYSTREANDNMWRAPQGVANFLRAYYHYKSADWAGNTPHPLSAWRADVIQEMPTYYIMDLGAGMAETVAPYMPSEAEVASCGWLTDKELQVYASEYGRTGFQGGLNWYRTGSSGIDASEFIMYGGKTLDVPSCFIAGASDWGVFQRPGSMESMRDRACSDFRGLHLVKGAGHWVQQEQPEQVSRLLLDFLASL